MVHKIRLLICVVLIVFSTSGRISAEPLTLGTLGVILETASYIGDVISFLDSGSSPAELADNQSLEILHNIQKRLSAQEKALEKILNDLEKLPDEVRKVVKEEIEIDQVDRVLGAIKNIREDIKTYTELLEENPDTVDPKYLDPNRSLHTLRQESSTLMQKKNDILILPAMSLAMETEIAFHHMRGQVSKYSKEKTQIIIKNLRIEYEERFMKMLAPWNSGSGKKQNQSLMGLVQMSDVRMSDHLNLLDDLLATPFVSCLVGFDYNEEPDDDVLESLEKRPCEYRHDTFIGKFDSKRILVSNCQRSLESRYNKIHGNIHPKINETLAAIEVEETLHNNLKKLLDKVVDLANSKPVVLEYDWTGTYERSANTYAHKQELARKIYNHPYASASIPVCLMGTSIK